MAANTVQEIRIHQDDNTIGHDIYCSIPVRRLVMNPPIWPVIHTFCCTYPTSWHLALAYQQEPETGKVCYAVVLRRADLFNGVVYASVSVSFLDPCGASVRFPRPVCSGQMSPEDVIHGAMEETRYPGYISYVFNLQLILKVSISIRYCHTVSEFCDDARLFCDEDTMLPSKL